MKKLIYEYLNNKYPNEFDIHYVNSREIAMYYNGERFLFMNPRSAFISYHMRRLIEIKDWFGQIQFNELLSKELLYWPTTKAANLLLLLPVIRSCLVPSHLLGIISKVVLGSIINNNRSMMILF